MRHTPDCSRRLFRIAPFGVALAMAGAPSSTSAQHVVTMDLGVQFGLTDPAIDTDAKVILGTLF